MNIYTKITTALDAIPKEYGTPDALVLGSAAFSDLRAWARRQDQQYLDRVAGEHRLMGMRILIARGYLNAHTILFVHNPRVKGKP